MLGKRGMGKIHTENKIEEETGNASTAANQENGFSHKLVEDQCSQQCTTLPPKGRQAMTCSVDPYGISLCCHDICNI